jgi:hypothetical protein
VEQRPKNERLKLAVDNLCGDSARQCQKCREEGDAMWGEGHGHCKYFGVCPVVIPELQPQDSEVLWLFSQCQSQWEIDFGGGLIGIRRESVEAVARALGVAWSEYVLVKFSVCEEVLKKQNAARIEARTPNGR